MYQPITGTGAGTAPVVNITFPYLDRSHVKATVDGVAVVATWTGASQITFSSSVPAGSTWKVSRETPSDPLVDFADGAVLTASDLDTANRQALYRQEEVDNTTLRADLAAATGSTLVGWKSAAAGASARTAGNKFDESLATVKDFGAVGDDATDNTAAFTAAAAAGVPLRIPAGIYRVGGITFPKRVVFSPGAQLRLTSGSLAFNGGLEAAVEQIFLGALPGNITINAAATPEGWVDWWGGDADAIMSAHHALTTALLSARDYYASKTVVLDQSYKRVLGAYGSAEGTGGTRIVYTGSDLATATIMQIGNLATDVVTNATRRLEVAYINTIRDGLVTPPTTDRRLDATKGWLISGLYESRIHNVFDYGSPIHYRIYGTAGCHFDHLGGVQPNAANVNGHSNFYTGFAIGGDAPTFGFVGANASLRLTNSSSSGATGDVRIGLYLIGYIADTWITDFEQSQMEYGLFVDGNASDGTPIAALTAHQDVLIDNVVLDSNSTASMFIQNINDGGGIQLTNPYLGMSSNGDGLKIVASKGALTLNGGNLIGASNQQNRGIYILNSKRVSVDGTLVKDFYYGVQAEGSGMCRLKPVIIRANTGGNSGMNCLSLERSYVAPVIDGIAASYDYGILSDAGDNYSEFNLSAINHGAFTTVDAGRKLWHAGAAVTTDTFGTSNLRSGVIA